MTRASLTFLATAAALGFAFPASAQTGDEARLEPAALRSFFGEMETRFNADPARAPGPLRS